MYSCRRNTYHPREFQQLKDTVHLNGCARRRARIFSPYKKIKFSTIVTRTDDGISMACCMVYSIDRRTIALGFHINVGTDFVPNTRLAPLIDRLAPPFDERAVL